MSGRPGSLRRVTFGTIGIVLTALGLVLLLLPGLASLGPAGILLDPIAATETNRVLLIAGGVAVASLLVGARSTPVRSTGDGHLDRRLGQLSTAPPEQVTSGPDQVAAAGLDAEISEAIESGGAAYREVQDALETAAVAVSADVAGITREEAAEAVARGTWTDDPVASALLSDDRGPAFGTRRTLRLLALPAAERDERLRRTIAAIERLEQP